MKKMGMEVERKKRRNGGGETEVDEDEQTALQGEDASGEESTGLFIEDVTSSEDSDVEVQNGRITRMRKRMEIMLREVKGRLSRKEAVKREAQLEACRNEGPQGSREGMWPDQRSDEEESPGSEEDYACTNSGDESLRLQETEDEANEGEGSEGEGIELDATQKDEERDTVVSDVENDRGVIHKERAGDGNESDYLMLECINITSFEHNMQALFKSKAKAIFFQEHKIRKKDVERIKDVLKKQGWAMLLSLIHI